MKDKEKTKTVFRIWPNGDVIALFPQIPYDDIHGYLCLSYLQVGQHGAANELIVVRQTRLAKPKEYRPLLKELQQLGYRPTVAKRCTGKDFEIRRAE
jgi:hypothetical protein